MSNQNQRMHRRLDVIEDVDPDHEAITFAKMMVANYEKQKAGVPLRELDPRFIKYISDIETEKAQRKKENEECHKIFWEQRQRELAAMDAEDANNNF